MLIEGIGKVSFVNGILIVQALSIGSDGNMKESGSIEIPGNMVSDIINGLSTGAKGISEKLNENLSSENTKANKKENPRKLKRNS